MSTGFRALFYGSLVTNTGDGIRLAALPLLAAQLTSSPFVIARAERTWRPAPVVAAGDQDNIGHAQFKAL